MFMLTVTEEEFLTLAEEIRPFTKDAMKIEVAPWIKDYVVDMDDLYTELSLEEVQNKPTGDEAQILASYKDVFEASHQVKEKSKLSCKADVKRVVR